MTKKREKAKTLTEICHILYSALNNQFDSASFRIHTMQELIQLKKKININQLQDNLGKKDKGITNKVKQWNVLKADL